MFLGKGLLFIVALLSFLVVGIRSYESRWRFCLLCLHGQSTLFLFLLLGCIQGSVDGLADTPCQLNVVVELELFSWMLV